MARTAWLQKVTTEEISIELADGVSAEQVQRRLAELDLAPLTHFEGIKDAAGKVLATVVGRDDHEATWECTDDGGD